MSKFFKLKEWLTLDDAVLYISKVADEPVSTADLYHFALNGDLKLSVSFVNGAYGVKGQWLKADDINNQFPYYDFDTKQSRPNPNKNPQSNEMFVSEDDWISWQNGVHHLTGVWDLTMQGDEALDVEDNYEQLTSGIPVTAEGFKGLLLQQGDVVCQLYKYFQSDKYKESDLYNQVYAPPEEAAYPYSKIEFMKNHPIQGLDIRHYAFFNKIRKNELEMYFVPCSRLVEQEFKFVIRTSEITRFIQSLEDTPQEAKPLHDKERTKFLLLLGSMLKKANFDLNERGIAGKIRRATESNNTPVSEQSIRDLLPSLRDIIELKQK